MAHVPSSNCTSQRQGTTENKPPSNQQNHSAAARRNSCCQCTRCCCCKCRKTNWIAIVVFIAGILIFLVGISLIIIGILVSLWERYLVLNLIWFAGIFVVLVSCMLVLLAYSELKKALNAQQPDGRSGLDSRIPISSVSLSPAERVIQWKVSPEFIPTRPPSIVNSAHRSVTQSIKSQVSVK